MSCEEVPPHLHDDSYSLAWSLPYMTSKNNFRNEMNTCKQLAFPMDHNGLLRCVKTGYTLNFRTKMVDYTTFEIYIFLET
jgi:hypothetical protein